MSEVVAAGVAVSFPGRWDNPSSGLGFTAAGTKKIPRWPICASFGHGV